VSPAQRKGRGRPTPRKRPPGTAGKRAEQARLRRHPGIRKVAVIVLGAAVVLTLAGFAIFRGLGEPSVSSGSIAVVQDAPNGTVTKAQYNAALFQAVPRLGLPKLPPQSSPQFAQVKDAAISDLLLGRWIEGEAAERGITASTSQVQDQLAQIVKTQFGNSQKKFQAFLKQSHFTQADALERVRLQVLSTAIQSAVLPSGQTPQVSADQVKNFYDANIAQFQQPETRDVRLVLNKSQAQVLKAKAALESNDSSANWQKVASKYSTDPTTKTTGGLRSGVAKGQSEPALDTAIFASPTGQVEGPIKGQAGYYVIEVEAVHPAATQPLAKVQAQIKQQLAASLQQQIATNFQTDFVDKWTSRTFCAAGYVISRCENYVPPSTTSTGGAAVPAIKPVPPGHASVFFTIPPQLPQGPIQPPPVGGAPGALPGGTPIPLGPGGAPSAAPPGSVPPSSVPPGTPPPTGTPPGG
jgi:foldase protein PrsA